MTIRSQKDRRLSAWIRRRNCFLHSWIFVLWAASSFVLATPAKGAGTANALGGWAEIEITPPLGIALGGRGGPETVATKVLDPLLSQITVLKDPNGTGLVLISLDVVGLPHDLTDRIRTDI